MIYLINLFLLVLLNTSFALNQNYSDNISPQTNIKITGEKVFLKKAKSYHFSKKDMIKFHDQNNKPFIVGLKSGFLNFNEDQNQKRILFLKPQQYKFYQSTYKYINKAPHLKIKFINNELIITGKAFDEQELHYLISKCRAFKNHEINLNLSKLNNSKDKLINTYGLRTDDDNSLIVSLDEKHDLHKCFSSDPELEKEYQISIALVEDGKLRSLTNGLGIQTALEWVFNPELTISNFSGSASFLKTKNQLKQNLNFKSPISLNSPLSFSDGTEVQVLDEQGIFRSRSSWKKAETSINLNLVEESNLRLKIKIDLNQKLRTGDTGVFKTNNFSKNSFVKIDQWTKILSFKKDNSSLSRQKTLGSIFLGSSSKGSENSSYSLWAKAER